MSARDDGLRCYKPYRRNGRMFWRNYHRDVPGGVTFVERLDELGRVTYRAFRDKLRRQVYGT